MIQHGAAERYKLGLSKENVGEVDMRQSVYDALRASGHGSHVYAIEGRIYAEDPSENFMPRPGLLQFVDMNSNQYDWLRVETYVRELPRDSIYWDILRFSGLHWCINHTILRCATDETYCDWENARGSDVQIY
jgi:hypothetical protein